MQMKDPVTAYGEFEYQSFAYKGEHIDGVPNGSGIGVYVNGLSYEGVFVNGKREGFGVLKKAGFNGFITKAISKKTTLRGKGPIQ